MSRVTIAAVGLAIIVAGIVALVLTGRQAGQDAAERDALQSEIETRERVDESLDRPDDCRWITRLRGNC